MRDGFYPAIGTPLDEQGNVIVSSLKLHVEDQLTADPAALLVMGSMGNQPTVKNSEYAKVAQIAVDAAKGDCPVFVGVMDNSIERVLDRINSLKDLKIDGVVATTSFYFGMNQSEVQRFFEQIAASSKFPVYMYDLPGVTKTKIEVSTATQLMQLDNIVGIKTGDLPTARELHRTQQQNGTNFDVLFSGLDVFDVAYGYGLTKQLDGMFACTTPINKRLYTSLAAGDQKMASQCLDDILLLRNTFVSVGVFNGFTYAMNLLGFEGGFGPDYNIKLDSAAQDKVKQCMLQLKLI
ncbi:dihydrodipicolinate synthase family protein [Paenibacillus nasutitermitis]|uniref:4-hydroxy-tetrahydrodipicolinate synthase n=1 Tax=Paenibacillus nasutitermitis TaxID=1652958 RepID=A0A917DNP5_9BACL|nr:dihydrodipicolinate synthase family protein [Paenibacillus nasutitermitis]GGD51948.1 4-hydroxy-tetrahydrodipicolinate synthase [Paenibacillus nasutitermitis]